MITETITFHFDTEEQQRRFLAKLNGEEDGPIERGSHIDNVIEKCVAAEREEIAQLVETICSGWVATRLAAAIRARGTP